MKKNVQADSPADREITVSSQEPNPSPEERSSIHPVDSDDNLSSGGSEASQLSTGPEEADAASDDLTSAIKVLPDSSIRRVAVTRPTTEMKVAAIIAAIRHFPFLHYVKKAGVYGQRLTVRALNGLRGAARNIRNRSKNQKSIKRTMTIKQTDRERVYKLRGYTTMDKVNAKRSAQRRFKFVQRALITLLCVGALGYVAFKNNPFTDIDELLRIVGIRQTQPIAFHQFEVGLTIVDPAAAAGEVIPPEADFAQIMAASGSEGGSFYFRAFKNAGELQKIMDGCKRKISDADMQLISADRNTGTILVILGKEGNSYSYRFSAIEQTGVMVDITATNVAAYSGEPRMFVIGLLSVKDYSAYSLDIVIDTSPKTTATGTGTKSATVSG